MGRAGIRGRNDRPLPIDIQDEDINTRLYEIFISWIYLHEQAHLFQNHGIISPTISLHSNEADLVWIDDAETKTTEKITGNSASISHAYELAADYEATTLLLQDLIKGDGGTLKKSTLWLLVFALACIFHRFHGPDRKPHDGVATGTHPDASLRMTDSFRAINIFFEQPEVQTVVPWARDASTVASIVYSGFDVGVVFREVVHSDNPGLPEFKKKSQINDESAQRYFLAIDEVWKELRPKVISNYFGKSRLHIRPFPYHRQLGA